MHTCTRNTTHFLGPVSPTISLLAGIVVQQPVICNMQPSHNNSTLKSALLTLSLILDKCFCNLEKVVVVAVAAAVVIFLGTKFLAKISKKSIHFPAKRIKFL